MTESTSRTEAGLKLFLQKIGQDHPDYTTLLVYQGRLRDNAAQQKYGDTEILRAERNQIRDALNELALRLLAVSFEDLCIQATVLGQAPVAPAADRFFPGLVPYSIEDAGIFFGRAREIELLVAQIKRDPVVVVNGLSGSGKSSLIRAGVIPQLMNEGQLVIYAQVYERLTDDVAREVRRTFDLQDRAATFLDTLAALYDRAAGRQFVIIVDQFEQALSTPGDAAALETFLKGIAWLSNQARRRSTVVIVLRADWLYFLESFLRRSNTNLNLYSFVFTVDPLTRDTAREAIVRTVEARGYPYDPTVVDSIVEALGRHDASPLAVGPYVQPVQLQLVLRYLLTLAERLGKPEMMLSADVFRQAGGVENILRHYLDEVLRNRPEAWRLLARFIGPDGRTGRTLPRSELLSVPAAADIELEIEFLLDQGLVEVFEADDGATFCRLSHDYLASAVADYLRENPDQQGWKLAEDWLARATLDWQEARQFNPDSEPLLERHRYQQIYQYRDQLRLTVEARQVLVWTALHAGHPGLHDWLARGGYQASDLAIVNSQLLAAEPVRQAAARRAASASPAPADRAADGPGPAAINAEQGAAAFRQAVGSQLRAAFAQPASAAQQLAAARALWSLKLIDGPGERTRIGTVLFDHWARTHTRQLILYVLTFAAFLLLSGLVYARNRPAGTWTTVDTLNAGLRTPLVMADPEVLDTVYAMTMSEAGSRTGSSLYVWQAGSWQLRSANFSNTEPTAMTVVRNAGQTHLYATLYSEGVLHSADSGQTWELVNAGLPSHGLTSIASDPDQPGTLFVGTNDWRGVLRSTDGGISWDYYDYHGEMPGAMITSLAFTRAADGNLVAGTQDGRILVHPRASDAWILRYGLPKGVVTALVTAPGDEAVLYAGTSRGIILRSLDGSATWEAVGQIANQFNITSLAVAPDNAQDVYASTYGNGGYTVWRSQDGGVQWAAVAGQGIGRAPIYSLAMGGPGGLYAGTQDGLFLSMDAGAQWAKSPLNTSLVGVQVVAARGDYPAPVYAGIGGAIYVNADGTSGEWTYSQGVEAETVRTIAVDPGNPSSAYAGVLRLGEWSVLVTEDSGQSWVLSNPPPIEPIVPDTMALAIAQRSNGQTVVYAGTIGCGVLRSTDRGRSWDTLGRTRCAETAQRGMPTDVYALAVDAGSADTVYAAASQHVYRSTDGGLTWQEIGPDLTNPVAELVTDPVQPGKVHLVAGLAGLWTSNDGGSTWLQQGTASFATASLTALAAVPNVGGHLVAGSSSGEVWRSTDGGASWQDIRENLAVGPITTLAATNAPDSRILLGSRKDGITVFTPTR